MNGAETDPLPIRLLSFNAGLASSKANLWWTAANETDFDHFEIERSIDGLHFAKAGSVGVISSSSSASYSFADDLGAEIAAGRKLAYYRLKLVDKNGKYSYSQVIPLQLNGKSGKLLLFPNPAVEQVSLLHEKAAANASIRILTADGRQVMKIAPAREAEQTIIAVGSLLKGSYTLEFVNAGVPKTIKFIKM